MNRLVAFSIRHRRAAQRIVFLGGLTCACCFATIALYPRATMAVFLGGMGMAMFGGGFVSMSLWFAPPAHRRGGGIGDFAGRASRLGGALLLAALFAASLCLIGFAAIALATLALS